MFPSSYQRPYYWRPYYGLGATPEPIADRDLICADGSVTCFLGGAIAGRTGTAHSALVAMQKQVNRVIRELGLLVPKVREDGIVDQTTADFVAFVLKETVSDAPTPPVFGELLSLPPKVGPPSPFLMAQQAPALTQYMTTARLRPPAPKPPASKPTTATTPVLVSVAPSPPRRLSTGTKVAIGAGVVAALGLGALFLARR